jgi:hypothetical protein
MATTNLARLNTAEVSFLPNGETEAILLAWQQSVSLNRSSEKEEVFSNDTGLGESVVDIEKKATYEFSTEIADLKLENLAIAFKGLVEEKTYAAGDIFITGKTINANDAAAGIGELIMSADDSKIHIATEDIAATEFDESKCADKYYNATTKRINPEAKSNNIGKIICDGVNQVTGRPSILVIPSVNLSFDGDFQVSGSETTKISLKGKCLKVDGENIFTLEDA